MYFILLLTLQFHFICTNTDVSPKEHLILTSSPDFGITVQTAIFVDKTLLVKEFMAKHRNILVTSPPRFGKSTNLHMIQRFLDIAVDDGGNRVPRNATENYKIFATDNLHIFQDKAFFDKHFCNYPTMLLDLKNLNCISYISFVNTFAHFIKFEYTRHKYLQFSNKLDDSEKETFKMFLDIYNVNVTDDEMLHSLATLTKMLFTHFNTKSVILIDDLDSAIQRAIDFSDGDVAQILDFIHKFLSITITANEYVDRALVNACSKHLDLVRNETVRGIPFVTDPRFSHFYGLMGNELQELFTRLNVTEEFKANFRSGGLQERTGDVRIYNLSVFLSYLEPRARVSYWAKSGNVKYFDDLLSYSVTDKMDLT